MINVKFYNIKVIVFSVLIGTCAEAVQNYSHRSGTDSSNDTDPRVKSNTENSSNDPVSALTKVFQTFNGVKPPIENVNGVLHLRYYEGSDDVDPVQWRKDVIGWLQQSSDVTYDNLTQKFYLKMPEINNPDRVFEIKPPRNILK